MQEGTDGDRLILAGKIASNDRKFDAAMEELLLTEQFTVIAPLTVTEAFTIAEALAEGLTVTKVSREQNWYHSPPQEPQLSTSLPQGNKATASMSSFTV
jgi:hypothetical protein